MAEEIIIDGVDVSECCCFENNRCLWTKRYYESDVCPMCEKINNCYYKQLKRLEQENEQLKKENKVNLSRSLDLNREIQNLSVENAELKAENDRLKEEIKVLQYNIAEYSNNNIDTAVTLFAKDKAKLEKENALLKAYKNKYYQQTLDDEIKLNELYQTLQEIKEICKNSHTSASEDYYRTADKILQKITKAEEE